VCSRATDLCASITKTSSRPSGNLPNIQLEEQAHTYNDLLDKFRTALLGNAGPMVVRLQILGGVEFASKGYIQELKPEDVGYATEDFWPGAMKSNMWKGKTYGIPTNNETMALIWNADALGRPRSRQGAGHLG
jgi:multiple sugar transport system substrate-binding protein